MLYRVRLDLAFQSYDPAHDILDKALDHLSEARTINPGQDNEERGSIETHRCYHDETPSLPCQIIAHHQTT